MHTKVLKWVNIINLLNLFHGLSAQASEQNREILIIGHRGCAGLRPENTMAAFNHAFNMGLDGIEFDVHLTRNGDVVVNHDYYLNPNLTRSSNGSWVMPHTIPIVDYDYGELQSYKLGKIKPDSSYAINHSALHETADEALPTLDDVLKKAKSYPDTQLHIEIKTAPLNPEISSDPADLTNAVLNKIETYGLKERCSILSFDWNVLKIVRDRDMSIPLVFLYEEISHFGENTSLDHLATYTNLNPWTDSIPKMVADLGGTFWSAKHTLLTRENIDEAHRLGLKVNAWTPNSEEEMRSLIIMGVDAITTDRPDILQGIVNITG